MTGGEADRAADLLRARYPAADVLVVPVADGVRASIAYPADTTFLVLGDDSPWLALFGAL
ncbi:MAG TPA: hypothetical protein VFO01_11520 [Trebonia sp.]|nr:hypothetical protein [Trebonia sp.]